MNKALKTLYKELQRLQGMENPPQDDIARTIFQINQEKAKASLSSQPDGSPPKDFGASMHALKEVIRGALKEYYDKNKPSS